MYLAKIIAQIINAFTATRCIFTALIAARKYLNRATTQSCWLAALKFSRNKKMRHVFFIL
jgi:hypothetical protein